MLVLLLLLSLVGLSSAFDEYWGQCRCGLRPSDERIVGGWPVRAHSYPWLAAIVQANDSARLVCGSSLISSEFALTGAHCVRDRAGRDTRPDALLVLLGAHNLSEQVGVQRMQIRSITVYPLFAYSKDTLAPSFDLALIRFRRPAVLNERVRPLCMHSLPFQRELPALLELLRTYPTLPAAAGQQTHLPRTSEGEPPAGDQPAPEPAPEPLPGGLEVAERWADEFLRQEPWPPGWPMMGAEGDQRRVRKPLLVAGWGSTSPEGDVRQLSQVPRHVGIQEMSSQMCTGSYGADVFDVQRSLCAARDGMDSCLGDSGGPVMSFRRGRISQEAVVSFGVDCGSRFSPGVNTLLDPFLGWIVWEARESDFCFD